MENTQTLSDFLKNSISLDTPGTYEIYEVLTEFPDERIFIIKNVLNSSKCIKITNTQNKVEVNQNFCDWNNLNGTKISFPKFLERLKGIGVNYV
jgi:hypothetical protein